VAVALRAGAGVATGTESAALSALTTLDQVLPARLRERVGALAAVAVSLRPTGAPPVDVDALMTVAVACRRPERLRFAYTDASGRDSDRLVEPYRLVCTDRCWYVVAYDATRDDWRTFRVDRMRDTALTGVRFTPADDVPDAATLVAQGLALGAYETQARVRLHATPERAARLVPPTIAVLEPGDDGTTIARIGGEPDWIARFLAGLECEFAVLEPVAVRDALRELGHRLVRVGS
jgi:predicted DNA-binding transcriptional regulator YafY